MFSFMWQLVFGAFREMLADWGTSPLGWMLIFIIPVGVLAMKAHRAEKGKVWIEVLENWREEIRDVFVVTLACSALIFSYELFFREPFTIWKRFSGIPPPPLLFHAPPSTTTDLAPITALEHNPPVVLRPLVKEEVFETLIPFPTSATEALPVYEPNLEQAELLKADGGDLGERYNRLIFLGIQAMQSGGANEPWALDQVFESLALAVQYYVIQQVDFLQSGSVGIKWVPGAGTVPLISPAIRPPDEIKYPGNRFVQTIYPNRLSRLRSEPIIWKARGYRVPRSTKITLHDVPEKGKLLTLTMRLENPSLYFLEVTVQPGLSSSRSLPIGYRAYPGLDMSKINTFCYTIKCHFELKRQMGMDRLEEEEYTKWADDLFAALKKNLAN
jgi:hypothetical protein